MSAEEVELFETFDDQGRSLGLVPRPEVHRRGLLHRAAHVLVFRSNGALLVQRRAPDKDLYPDLLDFSVGEHLRPGESFEEGALRGLHEELGVSGIPVESYGKRFLLEHIDEGNGVHDREETVVFKAVYDGPVKADPAEVAEVLEMRPDELRREVRANPDRFTEWFVADLTALAIV